MLFAPYLLVATTLIACSNALQPSQKPLSPALDIQDGHQGPALASMQAAWVAPELFFSEYQRLSAIHLWMKQAAELYSGHTELISVGTSYEGREMLGLKVSARGPPGKPGARRTTILL